VNAATHTTPPPALSIRAIRKRYGALEAVRGVSFEVARGEVLGLLGPNGAGKTTLIRVALDILRADAGEVQILGKPLGREARDRVGYLPEERGLYQRARADEVVAYAARLKGLGRREARARALSAIERVELAHAARRRVRDLSKGMQQKLQLAATVVHAPELLVLDEPLSGLDPINRRLVRDLIREEAARGAAVVLSSHEMDIVEQLCHRAILINRGEAILAGPVRGLRERFAKNEVRVSLRGGALEASPAAQAMIAEMAAPPAEGEGPRFLSVRLREGATPEGFLEALISAGLAIDHFERALPSLDDVFIEAVGRPAAAAGGAG
jgi:ABC-2 type transport system ATP-binding protein